VWIKSEEIGSLRLTVAVPRILFDADLTASTTELQVGEGTPATTPIGLVVSWKSPRPHIIVDAVVFNLKVANK